MPMICLKLRFAEDAAGAEMYDPNRLGEESGGARCRRYGDRNVMSWVSVKVSLHVESLLRRQQLVQRQAFVEFHDQKR